jgi:hypothetical protein
MVCLRPAGLRPAQPIVPKPPALLTAAASSGPEVGAMPATMIGTSIFSSFVSRVSIDAPRQSASGGGPGCILVQAYLFIA